MKFKKSRVLFLLPALIIVGLAACNRPKQVGQQPADQSAGSTGSGPAGAGVAGEGVVDLPSAGTTNSPALPPYPEKLAPVQFSDVTAGAGIRFRHNNGAYGKKYLPETTGSGCAFLDYDRDGWPDILLINGMDFADAPKKRRSVPALYHNNQNGTFSDVTAGSGLGQPMYGMGVAIGDYDNDGWDDIFITALGQNRLFRNLGESTPGKFGDVTAKVGMAGAPSFSTSAAWLDYDRDGRLDLFVGNYVDWAIENDIQCSLDGTSKSYCTPESYKGQSVRLYHNLTTGGAASGGRFEEVSEKAGVGDPTSKSLGVATLDYNRDGWIDIFVANDTQPNKLYQNNRNGTFTEMATTAGIAFSEEGKARAGMGVDFADYDGSGFPSLIVGNFSNEMLGVYHNEGKSGLFIDEAPASTLGQATLLTLTFGLFFFDYDLDGRSDIFLANGHVADDINKVQPKITYAMVPKLFRNDGNKKFTEVTARAGAPFQRPMVARGAAYGDFDNDGDLDILVTTNGGPAKLFRNDGGNQNRFLRIRALGSGANASGIGARVTVTLPDGTRQWQMVHSGSSYCSQSELTLTFGLGRHDKAERIEIEWPGNGAKPGGTGSRTERITNLAANHFYTIRQGSGISESRPIPALAPVLAPVLAPALAPAANSSQIR